MKLFITFLVLVALAALASAMPQRFELPQATKASGSGPSEQTYIAHGHGGGFSVKKPDGQGSPIGGGFRGSGSGGHAIAG